MLHSLSAQAPETLRQQAPAAVEFINCIPWAEASSTSHNELSMNARKRFLLGGPDAARTKRLCLLVLIDYNPGDETHWAAAQVHIQ